ncbi:MAG: hypothetical protein IPJ24_04300 [bacterium]|nr:hypothetical protein [bacterium]
MTMRRAINLIFLALGLPLLLAAAATAQSEPYSWSTSFDDDAQAGFVTADWNTTAGTLSLPPLVMKQVGSFTLGGTERDLAVEGRVLYVLDGRELFCRDAWRPTTMPLLGQLYFGVGANALAVDGGLVVVAMATSGLRLVDVTNPAAPVQVGTLAMAAAVDVVMAGRMAYVVDGIGSLKVVDLSDPAAPVLVTSITLPAAPTKIARDGDVLVVGMGSYGLATLDITIQAGPIITGYALTTATVLAVEVLGNRAFATTTASELRVYDISGFGSPSLVTTLPTVDACTVVRTDGDYLYAAGSTRLERWRRPYSAQPESAGTYATGGSARGLALGGRHAFLAATNVRALELVVPAPFGPRVQVPGVNTAIIDLHRDGDLMAVATTEGLALVDVSDPSAPFIRSTIDGGYVSAARLAGNQLVHISDTDGLMVTDVGNASAPNVINSVPGVLVGRLAVDGGRALTMSGGLKLWDISNPYSGIPQLGTLTIPTGNPVVLSVALRGDRACVGTYTYLHLYDVSDPATPAVIASVFGGDFVRNVAIHGDRLLATVDDLGLLVYDIGGAVPVLLGTYPVPVAGDDVYGLAVVGNRVILDIGATHVLHEVDISDPTAGIPQTGAFPTGSLSPVRMALGTSQAWITTEYADALVGMHYASHAWQPQYNYAEIVPQPCDGLLGLRMSAVTSGDPAAATWTVVVDGAWGDFDPAADGTPTPWQYYGDDGTGDWSWNVALELDSNGASPVITDLAFEFLYDRPVITAVADVPNDQGRQLRLTWRRSGYDRAGSPQPLLGYALYRLVDPALGAKALNPPTSDEAKSLPPGDWDYLGLYAADGEDKYSVIVPSLADASVEAGDYATTYLVRARTTTVGLNHDSLVLTGVSVDNLAPNVPQQVTVAYGGSGNALSWAESADADLRHFNVYRGASAAFVPGPGSLVHQTTGTGWTDIVGDFGAHYIVTAVDFAGNESEAAAPASVSGVPGASVAAFGLAQNVPNPFNPRTVIGFSLDRPGAVRLRIFDVAGRLVRTLHDGQVLPVGAHEAVWEGRDNAGQPVAAGVYHCRLETGGQAASRRLTMLK